MTVLITGAAGYIGRQVHAALAPTRRVIGVDIRPGPPTDAEVDLRLVDVCSPDLHDLVRDEGVTHVVHLAAVLEGSGDRARDHRIDVGGTANVIGACVAGGVSHLTVTSSGAAYGYHADNPVPLRETDPLRGNPEIAYADHKRQVEGLLADARRDHPQLAQLILRVGTVLGPTTDNLITALFDRRVLPTIAGSSAPFVFIWDEDLVRIITRGVEGSIAAVANVAGDGGLSLRDIGRILHRPVLPIPAAVMRLALRLGTATGRGRYGPEQVDFLRHRPVLDNSVLKEVVGYTPSRTSEQAFRAFAVATGRAPDALDAGEHAGDLHPGTFRPSSGPLTVRGSEHTCHRCGGTNGTKGRGNGRRGTGSGRPAEVDRGQGLDAR